MVCTFVHCNIIIIIIFNVGIKVVCVYDIFTNTSTESKLSNHICVGGADWSGGRVVIYKTILI